MALSVQPYRHQDAFLSQRPLSSMVSFDELKKKAAESASSAKTSLTDSRARSSGPKTKYTPSRIGEGRIISAEERAASR